MVKGIDVSKHQGKIDWAKVKASGIQFAMIRTGYGWDNDSQIDACFKANVVGAEAAGLPYGLYHYSYAKCPSDAEKEARWLLRVIEGMQPAYPVVFDFEEAFQIGGRDSKGVMHIGYALDQQMDIIEAFMHVLESAKYYAMLYMPAGALERLHKYAPDRLGKFDLWVAHIDVDKPSVSCPCGMWQYSWKGRIDGIAGDVDLNYAYKDYLACIRGAGLNGWGAKPPDYPALLESEKALRIAAETDRDAYRARALTAEAKITQIKNIIL